MVPGNEVKDDASADSPTSVLEDEGICEEKIKVKMEDDILLPLDAKNGDSSLISGTMAKEEEMLMEERVKEEDAEQVVTQEAPHLNDSQFTKLDELLTQTQLYSEFLLEKNGFHHILLNIALAILTLERKAKRAVAAMLTRSKEGATPEDVNLTEEERAEKEQAGLVPLLTGGKLKSYQIKGVKWLISLWQNGLNGILADQMGLGKTIQTIGFLAHLKGKGLDGPYLLILNLVFLLERFVPSINAIIYHGNRKERDQIRMKYMPRTIGPKFPIILTSYEVALNDARKYLRHYNWKYLVVDEGHRLKNSKCKLLKELKLLPVENKLLLTGTPLQNNLAELWFDLSGKCNNEAVVEELEERKRAQVVSKLHAILRPFLLRRMKSDVEQMLPRKKRLFYLGWIGVSIEHLVLAWNIHESNSFHEHVLSFSCKNAGRGVKGKLNNLMVQLRKNCNHPDLLESAFDGSYLYPPVEQIVEQCGKFRLLDRLLARLFARKHKVLIFSQWTKILDIMEYYFSEKGLEVCRIDGSVRLDERKRQVARLMRKGSRLSFLDPCKEPNSFQQSPSVPDVFIFIQMIICVDIFYIEEFNDMNSNCRVFLLSTRAGGLGINLTAADTCILYDSDWNPQMDLQAMDRCHRIGQTKPVHVYRLATAQSIEGRMLKRAFSKLKLEHVVIGKGQFQQERIKPSMDVLEEEDLLQLLQDKEDSEDKLIQTDISEEDLDRILDRSDLIGDTSNDDGRSNSAADAFPLKGPGWEVMTPTASGGMLSTLNS
ncbi:ATP-dependent DNA helicase DDM1 [Vitis vinifera]|uniref:ATP-dependent DNA helicase DDM1 n=1 Tax=Vitis vinifera TaxID=29760 RepID=A0A438CHM9_VITVI|nr:ATP-dependent DNA helicase DDM1 [Vitis vinifera]